MPRSKFLLSAQRNWQLTLAYTIWSSEVVVAIILYLRWVNGAFIAPAGWYFGGLFMLCTGILACIARFLQHQQVSQTALQNEYNPWQTFMADLLTILPPLLCGVSLIALDSIFNITLLLTLSIILCVAIFFVAETAHEKTLYYLKVIAWGESALAELQAEKPVQQSDTLDEAIDHNLEAKLQGLFSEAKPAELATNSSDQILQTMTRSLAADGSETIAGTLHIEIAVGEREHIAHIPFEPALAEKPELTVDANGIFAARVTPAAIHNYGTRLEIRLNEPAEEQGVVEISYRATASQHSTD